MLNIGEFNSLKIVRKANLGYFLDSETDNTNNDILLPTNSTLGQEFEIGDLVDAFIYRDSKDRIIATLKKPLGQVGDIVLLKVVDKTQIGTFVNIGLERDVLIPFKEQMEELEVGNSYLVYLYLDKTDRIAGTTKIDRFLEVPETFEIGDEVTGIVYGFQTNGSLMVAVEGKYRGVVLKNEYFTEVKFGETLNLRVKKYYEDEKIGLTPRQGKLYERDSLEEKIVNYLTEHGGVMSFNDKSSPEEIYDTFHVSKNNFKNSLGGLMKRNLIVQDEHGTKLK